MSEERIVQGLEGENKLKETRESQQERDNRDFDELLERLIRLQPSDFDELDESAFTKAHFDTLLLYLDTMENPRELKACERELDRRSKAYDTWKAKYGKEEKDGEEEKNDNCRILISLLTGDLSEVLLDCMCGFETEC